MPIILNAKAFYVSPSHINVYFFFYKCSGSQALSRILLAGRNWCSCLLQMLVNILYWSWGSGSWAGWLCMMSYSLHWWPHGRTRAPWNKSVQTAFMCSRGGAEKQGPPNGGIAAGQLEFCLRGECFAQQQIRNAREGRTSCGDTSL